ncbi:iron permease [Gloeopeniophorella convolvens]|nr:iron permease [Gloeopeniophorella convolvens]
MSVLTHSRETSASESSLAVDSVVAVLPSLAIADSLDTLALSIPDFPQSATTVDQLNEKHYQGSQNQSPPKDWRFWCIIASLALAVLLTAIEFTSIGAALPTIVKDLTGEQFIWVGSAYTLGSTALLPLCGGLAQIFGRRPIMLGAVFLFALGSAVCGAASSMNMLIAGRTVQGIGSGCITAAVEIIISDLATLRERGTYTGLMALTWAIGGGVGPVIGGVMAHAGLWRWLFYLNLPICAVTALSITCFLRLRMPSTPLREKLGRIDWIGNLLIVSSTTAIVIALTWGGVRYPWDSARVLVPLALGLSGLGVFLIYELFFCKAPIIPIVLRTGLTGSSGYLQHFLVSTILTSLSYWFPVFFEACKVENATKAGVDLFGLSYGISLAAVFAGIFVEKTGKYRGISYVGWILMVVGAGLLTTLRVDTNLAQSIGYQVVIGAGVGFIYVVSVFPILASVSVTQTAPALAFYVFTGNFAFVWGVTVGGSVLQNELKRKLPESIVSQFPQGVEIAYSIIPIISSLDEQLRNLVANAFADSLRVVWQVLLGIAAAGLLASLVMKGLPLHNYIDEEWSREDLLAPPDAKKESTFSIQSMA